MVYLHGWPQQDVSALIGGHLGITRLPVVSHLYYYTATVEDVHLRNIASGGCHPTDATKREITNKEETTDENINIVEYNPVLFIHLRHTFLT